VHIHRDGEQEEEVITPFFTLLDDIQCDIRTDALFFFDHNGERIHASEQIEAIFGQSLESLPTHFDLLHPQPDTSTPPGSKGLLLRLDRPMGFAEFLKAAEPCLTTVESHRGVIYKVSLKPLRGDAGGEPLGLLVSYKADASQGQRSLLEALLETLPVGVILADAEGNIKLCNKETIRITERTEWSSLYDTRPYILRTPRGEVLDTNYGPIKRTISLGKKELRGETFLLDFGGGKTRRVVCDVRRIEHDGEQLYIGFFRDVTERYARELRKDEFISIASHELRNPLTPLKGLLQIALQQHENEGEVDRQLLVKSLKQVDRLTKLVDGLLDLSRLETGRLSFAKQSTDLCEMLEEFIVSWRSRHGDDRFILDIPDKPITLELDAAGFEQVLNNLLDNALRFSPEDEPIIMRARQDGEHVFLEVEDHGVGLDEETAQRVFERFFQGDNSAKRSGSLGLGLYISHKIVEEHNGNISIRSERGERTVVEVSLPLR
jgi:signal transduction histidine kinase